MGPWWYCLKHNRVEPEDGCPNSERLGPFETKEEAGNAIENARERNEEWERNENEWEKGDKTQEKEL